MEDLLRNNYISYYGLSTPPITDITIETNESYFEIEDTSSRELVIDTEEGSGSARFSNKDGLHIIIVNYDKFVTSLSPSFQQDRKRCDFLLCSNNNRYFILGEIKDRKPVSKVRKEAKMQLLDTLRSIIAVQEISEVINSKQVKRCCYFNKQSCAPSSINATRAFNRLPNSYIEGFKMNNIDIESYNFEFFEYTGNQTMILKA
jgi:hypothetical protein